MSVSDLAASNGRIGGPDNRSQTPTFVMAAMGALHTTLSNCHEVCPFVNEDGIHIDRHMHRVFTSGSEKASQVSNKITPGDTTRTGLWACVKTMLD